MSGQIADQVVFQFLVLSACTKQAVESCFTRFVQTGILLYLCLVLSVLSVIFLAIMVQIISGNVHSSV